MTQSSVRERSPKISERIAIHIAICVSAILGWNLSRAVAVGVYDGFEYGNTTVNPAWFDASPGYGENGGIVVDPVRPNNLVWKARAAASTPGAHCMIGTTGFVPIAWQGFRSSVEILRTAAGLSGSLAVGNSVFQGLDEGFQVSFNSDGAFSLSEAHRSPPMWVDHPLPMPWNISQVPANQWLQVSMWHDPISGLIKADLRRLSDGYVYVQNSFTPTRLGGESPISDLDITAGSQSWNYLDNPTLTPEPGTLLLVALGGLAAMRRR